MSALWRGSTRSDILIPFVLNLRITIILWISYNIISVVMMARTAEQYTELFAQSYDPTYNQLCLCTHFFTQSKPKSKTIRVVSFEPIIIIACSCYAVTYVSLLIGFGRD